MLNEFVYILIENIFENIFYLNMIKNIFLNILNMDIHLIKLFFMNILIRKVNDPMTLSI